MASLKRKARGRMDDSVPDNPETPVPPAPSTKKAKVKGNASSPSVRGARRARGKPGASASNNPGTPAAPEPCVEKDKAKSIADGPVAQTSPATKRKPRRPCVKAAPEMKAFELSVTISIGGGDVDVSLLQQINNFLVQETIAGKCSLERGGTAYHLHFQMVFRIQAVSIIAVSRLLKKHLGWDKAKPAACIVICKSLSNKGLHTFHGLVGYCMKDAEQDHFQTIDHNVTAEDIALGLEQLALHGKEESLTRIMLTQRNFMQKCLMWRRWNYRHPAVPDWETEFYLMLKTGKYYPCSTSWVVSSYGRGYEPYRVQSLWRMLVAPTTITPSDVTNVFCQPDQLAAPLVSRREWFAHRWEAPPPADPKYQAPGSSKVHEALAKMQDLNDEQTKLCKDNFDNCAADILVEMLKTPVDASNKDLLVHTPVKHRIQPTSCPEPPETRPTNRKKKSKPCSPTRRLWPEEWNMDQFYTEDSSSYADSDSYPFGVHAPVYRRTRMPLIVD